MASTGVNVLRWSALVVGVFYGFSHQSAISSRDKTAKLHHEYENKQKLIEQAKLEWKKKTEPPSADSVIRDSSDPRFDLEKYISKVAEENP